MNRSQTAHIPLIVQHLEMTGSRISGESTVWVDQGQMSIRQSSGTPSLVLEWQFPDSATAIRVRSRIGGQYVVRRVEVGPPDSGGAGYRALRIPN
jgi:hypothetical protein